MRSYEIDHGGPPPGPVVLERSDSSTEGARSAVRGL